MRNIYSRKSFGGILLLVVLLNVECGLARRAESLCGEQYRTPFNKSWCFKLYEFGTDDAEYRHESLSFDDSSWKKLNIPHDWGIEGSFHENLPNRTGKRPFSGIGWYRKHFTLPISDKGKRIFIDIDGAMSQAKVWLNGEFLGEWPYGYASFRLEMTPHIKFGRENIIAIRLNNPPKSSRWYPGGGLYRNVWLVKTHPVHIGHWGTFVRTSDVNSQQATIKINTTIDNQDIKLVRVSARYEISLLDTSDVIIISKEVSEIGIPSGKSVKTDISMNIENPELWDVSSPTLYLLKTTLYLNQKPIDVYYTSFGIRSVIFDSQKGFFLNGKRIRFKGVCLHHDDMGPLGTALHRCAIERQLEILKEMGCNAIRCSHNPPSPDFLELCDKKGFLVINEAFDCWAIGKTRNGYHQFFDKWYERDIISFVHRDRNHPCVVMWSSGNEPREQKQVPAGVNLSREITAIFHREDPTRPVTVCSNLHGSIYNKFAETVDVYGLNYQTKRCKEFHAQYPNKPVYSSESVSCISSRGEYFFPVRQNKNDGHLYYQVSSYDMYSMPWGERPDLEFAEQDKQVFVLGEFVWAGFDYLGEPMPYNRNNMTPIRFHTKQEKENLKETFALMGSRSPARSSYFGIMDLCGFKKDRFFLYQAKWRPDYPMAHILPHWNWPERVGEITPVHVYTSGDEAELFLNGKSLGRKKKKPFQYRLIWDDVLYESGILEVVAYKHGVKWAESIKNTTEIVNSLVLEPDRKSIKADGCDLSYITVKVVDKNGFIVPRSSPLISFSVEGPGEILATGNGNAIDHTSFQSKQRKAYNGLCLVIVRSLAGQTGDICIQAKSEGIEAVKINIKASLSRNN